MVTGIHINITQNSQNAANNSSNVTVALVINWNGGSYNATGNAPGTLTVDGTLYNFKAVFNTAQKTSGSEVFYSKTVDVPHNDDGSKTLACQASFDTQTMAGTVTAAATKTLTQIARESTVSAAPAHIGAASAVTVDRKNTAYTHSIAYQFGSLKGYIKADGGVSASEVKLTATSIPFAIPESFYAQIPDDPSADCTLTIRTYSGSTQIGQPQTCSFKVTAAEDLCKPVVEGTVVDINEATLALTGDENKLVRGMSTALCTMTAQARNSATLKSRSIGGAAVSGNTRTIENIELTQVVFSATDSREYTGTDVEPVEMVDYVPLTCNVTAKRTDPTSGNAVLEIKGNCFHGSFGAADNSLTVRYSVGGGEYVELVPQISGNEYTASASLSGLDYQSSHTITVESEDKLKTVTKTVTVGKGIPVFDWGENDFNFNCEVKINNTSLIDIIYPVGSIYMSVNAVSPAAFFGGTWEKIENRFLLAAGSKHAAGETGGEETHTLTEDEMPTHGHKTYYAEAYATDNTWGFSYTSNGGFLSGSTNPGSSGIAYAGGGAAHNNMPPYLAVYMWKRTA